MRRARPGLDPWALAVFICVFGVVITNCALFSLFLFHCREPPECVPSSSTPRVPLYETLSRRGPAYPTLLCHSVRYDTPSIMVPDFLGLPRLTK